MKQEEFNEQFRNRAKCLALSVIGLVGSLAYTDALGVLRKQLIRSVTSVAANFSAVCRARSQRERFSKLCIVVEEADETLFWLEMIVEGKFIAKEKIDHIYNEAEEILKVMSAFKTRLSQNP